MAQARSLGDSDLEPFPDDWAVTFASGKWSARLDPEVPLTDVELELGYGRTIERTTRPDLLDAVRSRDELRNGTWT